jgi:hypothetical protein
LLEDALQLGVALAKCFAAPLQALCADREIANRGEKLIEDRIVQRVVRPQPE